MSYTARKQTLGKGVSQVVYVNGIPAPPPIKYPDLVFDTKEMLLKLMPENRKKQPKVIYRLKVLNEGFTLKKVNL